MANKPTRIRAAAPSRRAPVPSSMIVDIDDIELDEFDDLAPPLFAAASPPVVQYTPRSRPAALPAPDEEEPEPAPFDANGFDPGEFEWRPVARRPRRDGWTPEVQARFIEALAQAGLVSAAAEAVNMSLTSCYRLRNTPGSENFARAWRSALVAAAERVVDVSFQRVIEGDEVPIFHQGRRIGAHYRHSDRLAMFLMRAYLPGQFRHAHQDKIQPGEVPAAPHVPLIAAIEALAPVTPTDPHLLMSPERLAKTVEQERIMAEVDELYPRDEHEKYVRPHVGDRDDDARVPDPEPYDPADYRNYPRE